MEKNKRAIQNELPFYLHIKPTYLIRTTICFPVGVAGHFPLIVGVGGGVGVLVALEIVFPHLVHCHANDAILIYLLKF